MLPTLSAFTFAASTSTETKVEFWAATGSIVGIVLFIRGLMLGFKRLIMNTPSSKIRSALRLSLALMEPHE